MIEKVSDRMDELEALLRSIGDLRHLPVYHKFDVFQDHVEQFYSAVVAKRNVFQSKMMELLPRIW